MSIIFTRHAKERMLERGISKKEIEQCIMFPTKVSMESQKIRHFYRSFQYANLEVVVELKGNHYIVVTVYQL